MHVLSCVRDNIRQGIMAEPTRELDELMALYAGPDYDRPRRIPVVSIDFGGYETPAKLMAALQVFVVESQGANIEIHEDDGDAGHYRNRGFQSWRMETAAEVGVRVDTIRAEVQGVEGGVKAEINHIGFSSRTVVQADRNPAP